MTKDKGDGHLAHRIDTYAEDMLMSLLSEADYRGTVFSEEAGVVVLGDDQRLFATDPYCNTSLTFRGIRESAVTGFEIDEGGAFISAAVADLQCWRSLVFVRGVGLSMVWEDGGACPVSLSSTQNLADATVVISLMKRHRRSYLQSGVAKECGLLLTVDGGIVAARICAGDVDAFLDHKIGQPAYEALPYRLVELAGGTVTDADGLPVDWEQICSDLRRGVVRRQRLVVAGNRKLHDEMMARLDE
ncbi:hypothetical protein [Promicromonospora sp. NPDC050249]|uniref:hypothetical protein n=1 Tax=Promicromonospora sp. NPDC050249 TaxID=3154743 RepID=UPI003407FE6F